MNSEYNISDNSHNHLGHSYLPSNRNGCNLEANNSQAYFQNPNECNKLYSSSYGSNVYQISSSSSFSYPSQTTTQNMYSTLPSSSQMINNQLSSDINSMHITQSEFQPLLTSGLQGNSLSRNEGFALQAPTYSQSNFYNNIANSNKANPNTPLLYTSANKNIASYPLDQNTQVLSSIPHPSQKSNFAPTYSLPEKQISDSSFIHYPTKPSNQKTDWEQFQCNQQLSSSKLPSIQNNESCLPSSHSSHLYNSMHQTMPSSSYNHSSIKSPPINPLTSFPQTSSQPKRLDPDNMPSPIQVIEDDRKLKSSFFGTNQKGQIPPLVTTNFKVIDEGICSPRFVRSTIYNVPTTAEMLKQTNIPFALVISPFARPNKEEKLPPLINPGEQGPVRCHRCKAYMCPFMQFIDAGRRFHCVYCKHTSEVPPEYFAHLDHMGERVDKFSRPELCFGSYEFVANSDYCKNGKFPNNPAFIFLIDVSYNSIRSGMVKILCDNMQNILYHLPRDNGEEISKIRVGFITYSSVIHFYNIKNNLVQPQMLVVSDVHNMFMPLLDGFLVHVSESHHVIQNLMNTIPSMFAETKETETILGPAIQAGLEALKAADCAGKLFIFHSSLPIGEAPGKLKNRDERKLLGTDKEKIILSPQTTFYNNLAQDCVLAGCCVDLFLFNNSFIDVATLGQICKLTGGQLYKYTYFQMDIDGEYFIEDLKQDVMKPIVFDAIMRVRTSTGIRPTEFLGNFFMSNTTDIEFSAIDCDQSVAVGIKYDDKLLEDEDVHIQCAILFTSCGGIRKLRIHNLVLNSCTQMAELFRACELDTLMNIFLKEGVKMVLELTPKQVKDYFINRAAKILACYRKNCAQATSAGQLILPECMKLLPLYINSLINSDVISGGPEMTPDDRSFIMFQANCFNVTSSAAYLYPRLLPLHDIDPKSESLPVAIRCSIDRLKEEGAYLLENGMNMFLWIGKNINQEWLENVFSVSSLEKIDIGKGHLLNLDNSLSIRIRTIIDIIRKERKKYMRLYIIRQADKLELLFRHYLVEDRISDGSISYVDFLCHLHKEIKLLLS